jgi:hypothetical protein
VVLIFIAARLNYKKNCSIENADELSNEIEGSLDNLNAFGPAGAELEMALNGIANGVKYVSTVLRLVFLFYTNIRIIGYKDSICCVGNMQFLSATYIISKSHHRKLGALGVPLHQ